MPHQKKTQTAAIDFHAGLCTRGKVLDHWGDFLQRKSNNSRSRYVVSLSMGMMILGQKKGLGRDLNPGPVTYSSNHTARGNKPEATIIPLDHQAMLIILDDIMIY